MIVNLLLSHPIEHSLHGIGIQQNCSLELNQNDIEGHGLFEVK